MHAETDDAAVGFYRKAGFQVREGVARFGMRRYACLLTASWPPSVSPALD